MRIICLLFLCIYLIRLNAQELPVFLSEDTESQQLDLHCLCKPGVYNRAASRGLEISYLHVITEAINAEDGFPLQSPRSEFSIENFDFRLRFPIVNKEGFKVIGGVMYRPERFNFVRVGVDYSSVFNYLDNKRMKSSGYEAIISKSLNEKFYSALRLRLVYNGDYSGLIKMQDRYAIFNASGIFGVKKHDDFEYGFGLNFKHSFRNTSVLPFFIYNHTFNLKWGLETILPARIRLRRNWNDAALSFVEVRFNSRSYAIETDDQISQIFHFNHSEIRFSLSLEQRIHPWIWVEGNAGFQNNFIADFESQLDDSRSFQIEPGSSPFFKISIFVAPPRDRIK